MSFLRNCLNLPGFRYKPSQPEQLSKNRRFLSSVPCPLSAQHFHKQRGVDFLLSAKFSLKLFSFAIQASQIGFTNRSSCLPVAKLNQPCKQKQAVQSCSQGMRVVKEYV